MTKTIFETPDIPKKKNTRRETQLKPCAHEGCTAEGLYPAPRSRHELRHYIWFCLEHIRAYNRQWNYFADLDGDAMEAAIRHSTTWERPSWRFGTGGGTAHSGVNGDERRGACGGRDGRGRYRGDKGNSPFDADFIDPLGLFGAGHGPKHGRAHNTANGQAYGGGGRTPLDPDERKAFDIFGLTPCADSETVKKRYKELAKAHHPDANGGSREAEDRLKIINRAYGVLKHRITSRP